MNVEVLTGFFIAFSVLLVIIALVAYSKYVKRRYVIIKYKSIFDALFIEYREWLKMKKSSIHSYHKSSKTEPTLGGTAYAKTVIKDNNMDKGVEKHTKAQQDKLIAKLSADLMSLKMQKTKEEDEKRDLCKALEQFLKTHRLEQLVFDSSCVRFNVEELKKIQQYVEGKEELKIVIPYDSYQELLLLRQSDFYGKSASYLSEKFRFNLQIDENSTITSGIKRLYRYTPKDSKIQIHKPTCIVFCNYLRFYEFVEYTDDSKNIFAICLDLEFSGIPKEVYNIESIKCLKEKCANTVDIRTVNSIVKKDVSKPSIDFETLYIGEFKTAIKKNELKTCLFFGGEGSVYEHPKDNNLLIKLYDKCGIPCEEKIEKLQSLIEKGKQLNNGEAHFAFPIELVYNDANNTSCVGFTMPKIKNKRNLFEYVQFHEQVYFGRTFNEETLPLVKNILLRYLELEVSGIYYIDCALENILYDPDTHEVFFVDMDSAQVNNHISTVYRNYLLHPDIDEDIETFCAHHLREPNHIEFSLYHLILQVLLCVNNFLRLDNDGRIKKSDNSIDLSIEEIGDLDSTLDKRWFKIFSIKDQRKIILNELQAKAACTTGDFICMFDDIRKLVE